MIWLWALLGCNGDGTQIVGTPTSSTSSPTPQPEGFEARAQAAGWLVTPGSFGFLQVENCCEPCGNCLWNNPSTPYGHYDVPPSPGQTVPQPEPNEVGPTFHFRPDEVVVYLGRTPPASKYFSYRSYLSERLPGPGDPPGIPVDPDTCDPGGSERALAIGSLGPSLNQLVVAAELGDPYDQPIAVITSADGDAEDQVRQLLIDDGWDASHIFTDRLPAGDAALDLRLGLRSEHDSFQVAIRVAAPTDPSAYETWTADPGEVLRLTPAEERTIGRPHARESLPPIGAGLDEEAWRADVNALGVAVLARWPAMSVEPKLVLAWDYRTYDCIEQDLYCSGEIRDRMYASSARFTLADDGSFAVAYGVNHERTGRASYANFAVDTVDNFIGITAVNSDRMPGSAAAFLPKDADDLYAWVIARDCTPHAAAGLQCVEITDTCPTGLAEDEDLFVSFRAYLDPATGAKPLSTELVADRVLVFRP